MNRGKESVSRDIYWIKGKKKRLVIKLVAKRENEVLVDL